MLREMRAVFPRCFAEKQTRLPELEIKNYSLIEDSGDKYLDSKERENYGFALINNGNSPSRNIRLFIRPVNINDNNREIFMDTTKIIENLNIDEAKYFDFDISAGLKVKSGDWKYILTGEDENGFKIKNPYEFIVKTRAVEPPE